jgi:hypothetical protein
MPSLSRSWISVTGAVGPVRALLHVERIWKSSKYVPSGTFAAICALN